MFGIWKVANAFLMSSIEGVRPGRALEIAVGQGRNAEVLVFDLAA